jgi:uncharacterized protein (TIGR03067 family)
MSVAKRMLMVSVSWAAWGWLASATEVPPPAPAEPDDRAVSVGRWDVVAVEMNGKPVDPELVTMLKVVYRADGSWSVLFKSLTVAEGTSRNNQDATPKTFEMETLGSEKIKPCRYAGIYRIEGDSRLLCFVSDGMARPDTFAAPQRSCRVLVTLRRASEP